MPSVSPQSAPDSSTPSPSEVANALTVDVEDYFQVGVFQDQIDRSEWDAFECRVERNLDLCVQILAERDIKATFFVLGWVAERFPKAIRSLVENGHEVGSHGYGHDPIWKLDPKSFREDLKRSLVEIGNATGVVPTSYRAPCFSVTQKTLWALDILAEEGIIHDSSIFPVSHPEYGIPGAERRIHRVKLRSGAELMEFPMTVGKMMGRTMAFCGGGWFRLFPYWVSRRALAKARREQGPFVFYLHPWELDPEQPRLHDKTGKLGRFRHYVNLERNEAKFRSLLDDFEFTTLGDVFRSYEGSELPEVTYQA